MKNLILLVFLGLLFVQGDLLGQDNRKLPTDSDLADMKNNYINEVKKRYPNSEKRWDKYNEYTREVIYDVIFSDPIKYHEKIELGKPKEYYENIGYSRAKWSDLVYVVKFSKILNTTYDNIPKWGDNAGKMDTDSEDRYFHVGLYWASEEDRWFLQNYSEAHLSENNSLQKEYGNLKNQIFKDTKNVPGFAPEIDFKTTDSAFSVAVSPSLSPKDNKIGLIPAIDEARALISYKGNPNKTVLTKTTCDINGSRILLAKHPMRELNTSYAKNAQKNVLEFKTDSDGRLDLVVFFLLSESEIRDAAPLNAPKKIQILLREEGEKENEVEASIKVGLGLQIYDDKMINVSPPLEATSNHVYYAFIKSLFHKNFDLLAYQERNNNCPVAKEMVVNLRSVPINFKPDGSHMVDGVSGKADIVPVEDERRRSVGQYHVFSQAPKGVVLTVASYSPDKQPYHEHKGIKLPAINQKKNGFYTKGIYGMLQLAEREERSQERIPARIVSLEPRVLDGKVFVLSVDEAQSFYASLACMLEAQTANQLAVLTLLETIPPLVLPIAGSAIGEGVSLTRNLAGALCNLVNGEYQKFVEATESFAEKEALGFIVKNSLIPKMVSGKSSESFLRLINENVSNESRQRLAKALETAYGTVGALVDEANYEFPNTVELIKEEIKKTETEIEISFTDHEKFTTKGGGDIREAQERYTAAKTKLKNLEIHLKKIINR